MIHITIGLCSECVVHSRKLSGRLLCKCISISADPFWFSTQSCMVKAYKLGGT